jgi:cyclophilin family peptidyl-prolyl cis-trans isomerase
MKVEAVNPSVYLDIKIGAKDAGRVVIELYEHQAPRTASWFQARISKRLYDGVKFGRAIKNFMVQTAVQEGQDAEVPALENPQASLDAPFQVCTVHDGSGNFFITTFPQPHLQGQQTVFGQVSHGKFVVRQMEQVKASSSGVPEEPIEVTTTGMWTEGMDVPVADASYDTRGGDIYEEYPDDDTHIDKESSELVYDAACAIKESGTLLYKAGDVQLAFFKYRKCLRYVMDFIPDIDQEPEWYKKYSELKTKLYLNLSLTAVHLKNWQKTIDYATYIIELGGVDKKNQAKAYFRRGKALVGSKKYEEAICDFKQAQKLAPDDKAIGSELSATEELVQRRKANEKAKYAKFFK